MRIRKRFPPPSNNLSSDPKLHNSTLLVQQQVHFPLPQPQQAIKTNPQPSNSPNQPHPTPSNHQEPLIKLATQEKMVLINEKDGFGEIKSNDTWKDGTQCAVAGSELVLPSSSSYQVFGGWFGEDRAIPIKKRRGSLGKRANKDSITTKEEEKTVAKMKSKTNKKCEQENGDVEQEDGKESLRKEGIDLNIASHDVKKNIVKRGSVIMEGSRCSRVNGRGWRCCQQTLVGYSLCEHHLGKGRLRSMNSVRNQAKSKNGSTEIDRVKPERLQQEKKQEIVMFDHDNEGDDDDDYDEENDDDGLVMKKKKKKKKKKIGMVKARSISSLLGLGQRESEVMVDENDKNRSS